MPRVLQGLFRTSEREDEDGDQEGWTIDAVRGEGRGMLGAKRSSALGCGSRGCEVFSRNIWVGGEVPRRVRRWRTLQLSLYWWGRKIVETVTVNM